MKYKWFLWLPFLSGWSVMAQQPVVPAVDSTAIKTLFFAGLRDKLNENYSKASENFNKALVLDPNNAAICYEIAAVDYRQNKLEAAELMMKKAAAIDANNIWYWKFLSELYKQKGDMDALVPVFNQMIRLAPETDSFYFDRSNALLIAGKTDEALKGYDELEQKFGPSAELAQARQRVTMEKMGTLDKKEVDQLLSDQTADSRGILYASSMLVQKGQLDEALQVLKKAQQADPENFEVDLAMADVYKALKDHVAANLSLQHAFSNLAMPVDQKVKIVVMLFAGMKNQQRINDAAALAQIAVKLHPDDPKILALYGDVLYKQGDLESALVQFKSVLKLTDQLYAVWEQVLNIQTGRGLYEDAIATANEALSVYPNQAVLYYYLALALQHTNQNDQALINIKSALQLDTENGVYLEFYGDVLFLTGDEKQALVHWKMARAAGNDAEQLTKKINEKKYIQ